MTVFVTTYTLFLWYTQSHLQPLPVKTVQAHLQVKEEDSMEICVQDMVSAQSLVGGTALIYTQNTGV